jgi:alcohol dehydrogenase
MSHPVSAYYNVAHGVANAILLPTVMEYNSLADRGKYLNIYNYISKTPEDTAHFVPDMLVQKIRHLNAQLMIPESLGAVGVTEEHLDAMADDAMKSGNIAVNPRKTEKKDILELYRKAL